jgi:hypothetical protein
MGLFLDFERVFMRLNEKLSDIGQFLQVVCAGGYVMQLHGYKATADVDAFFKTNAAIENVIKQVGDEFGINTPDELWLNNNIASMNADPPAAHQRLIHNFSHLTVKAVDITYLIGMKLTSLRNRDMVDLTTIINSNNELDPIKLYNHLTAIGFNIDVSAVLEAFGEACGIAWLESYYIDHESEIISM